jgi:hypothetical protein
MLGRDAPGCPAALRAFFTVRFIPEPWSIASGSANCPPALAALRAQRRQAGTLGRSFRLASRAAGGS